MKNGRGGRPSPPRVSLSAERQRVLQGPSWNLVEHFQSRAGKYDAILPSFLALSVVREVRSIFYTVPQEKSGPRESVCQHRHGERFFTKSRFFEDVARHERRGGLVEHVTAAPKESVPLLFLAAL